MTRTWLRQRIAGSAVSLAVVVGSLGACDHAWSGLEPLAGSSAASTGSGGASTGTSSTASTSSSATGGTGGTSSSTGTGGDAGVDHCGGTDNLTWDFASARPDAFYQSPQATLSAGQGVVAIPVTTSGYWEAKFSTTRVHDLRGDRVYVKVPQVPAATSPAVAALRAQYDNGDQIYLTENKGILTCGASHDGGTGLQTPYDPAAALYWQLREDQGTIHCETSPDGATWHEIAAVDLSTTTLAPPARIRVEVSAYVNGANTVTDTAHFDDLNGGGTPTGHWCKATTLTDTFPATEPVNSGPWDRGYTSGTATIDFTGDVANLRESGGHGAGIGASTAYDLTGQRVSMEVLALPTQAQGALGFRFNTPVGLVGWNLATDGASCGYQVGSQGATFWQGPGLTLPATISLRESGGTIFCEVLTTKDGGAQVWEELGSAVMPLDVSAVDPLIFAYYSGNSTQSWLASFDNYNLPPVP